MSVMTKLGLVAVVIFAAWKFISGPSSLHSDVSFPLTYRTHVVGPPSSEDRLPMMIALHGAGADEEDLVGIFDDWKIPMRVVFFRGPVRMGGGYTWSEGKGMSQVEALAAQKQMFRDVAESIAIGSSELAGRYPTVGKPMVFGFSRGAAMAWYLGASHPDRFSAIFEIAGELDDTLLKDLKTEIRPPFFAYHGRADGVVGIQAGRRTAAAIERAAGDVVFEEFDGAHTVPKTVVLDIQERVARL